MKRCSFYIVVIREWEESTSDPKPARFVMKRRDISWTDMILPKSVTVPNLYETGIRTQLSEYKDIL